MHSQWDAVGFELGDALNVPIDDGIRATDGQCDGLTECLSVEECNVDGLVIADADSLGQPNGHRIAIRHDVLYGVAHCHGDLHAEPVSDQVGVSKREPGRHGVCLG